MNHIWYIEALYNPKGGDNMAREAVKDWTGKVLGWVDTDSRGNQTVYNFGMRVLAKYDAQNDRTTDFAGKVLSRGNTAVAYIYKNNE